MFILSRMLPVAALLFTFSAFSAENIPAHQHHGMAMPMSAEQPVWQSQGVVKKMTDRQITLSHAAIEALNWPPMTMAFDRPAHLPAPVQVGDKVTFTFSQTDSGYQLFHIAPLR